MSAGRAPSSEGFVQDAAGESGGQEHANTAGASGQISVTLLLFNKSSKGYSGL